MSFPNAFETISWTSYIPFCVYVWDGCCKLEKFPSPKSQYHDVGLYIDWSTNCTTPVHSLKYPIVASAKGAWLG